MKQGIRRSVLATVLATAMVCCAVLPAGAVTVIFDTESGETPEELMSLTAPAAWEVEAVPTVATSPEPVGKGALLMDEATGTVLYEHESHRRLPIASVTKVMTLLLVVEALDGGLIESGDEVTCSAEAASLGGSQIWLEPGEVMTVHELLKAAAVVSANDACAALAEYVAGSQEEFVQRMNARAADLGMNDTEFHDCSGLDDTAFSCAYDVAVMARELMKHPRIKQYTTIWMDTLRGGQSQLVNTNKLIRFYSGATGLKTGTTSTAGHNLAATAERDGLGLVAVVLGCATTAERFGGARKLLDHGFAHYAVYTPPLDEAATAPLSVLHGRSEQVAVTAEEMAPLLIEKGTEKAITCTVERANDVEAPVEAGQIVGTVRVMKDGNEVAVYTLKAAEAVRRLNWGDTLLRLWRAVSGCPTAR